MPQDKGPVEFRVMQNRQEVMQEGKRTKSKNGQIEPLPIHQGWKGHQGQKGAKISCQDAARVQKNVCGPIGRITLQVNLPNAELLKVDIRVGNKCQEKIWILFGLCNNNASSLHVDRPCFIMKFIVVQLTLIIQIELFVVFHYNT